MEKNSTCLTFSIVIDCYALLIETIAQLDRASVCGTEGRRFESSWSRFIGEMSEWSKEPDSKSGVVLCITEGSNPSLSETICIWRGVRVVEGARLEVVYGQKPSGVRIPPSPFSSRYLAMNAAQPRQDRNVAAVSGKFMRPGPFAAVFYKTGNGKNPFS